MEYHFLRGRGALSEADPPHDVTVSDLATYQVPKGVLALVPEAVARENLVLPLRFDGETITCVAVNPSDIALADRLRFLLAKNVRLVPATREKLVEALNRHYGQTETESVDSMLMESTATSIDLDCLMEAPPAPPASPPARAPGKSGYFGTGLVEFKKGLSVSEGAADESRAPIRPGLDLTPAARRNGMFFYTVEEGQRVLMRRPNGTIEIITGPRRVWRGRNRFELMSHYVAYPGTFLLIRYRDGRQEHKSGPAEVWFDPRQHLEITRQDALQLACKEAVVVYSARLGSDPVTRRVEYGPALFVPEPGEWLHTFSWHASKGGSRGAQKVPNALVFQKLWLMPDQMYHDVADVRTADDAVITVRLMIFFELVDIERMLDTTHDPIGDFVNAATSDVVAFTGRHDFESFKRNTGQLNELETYRQLTGRAGQCGYRINKVVYRGYGAADALQQMHDEAIQARTRLQLDRATEQQAQQLEDFKLESQLARAAKRRTEQTSEVEHDLELGRKRQEAELRQKEAQETFARERLRQESELRLAIRRGQDAEQREHLAALHGMGLDLTAYLTQGRADRIIELRGAGRTHVHLDPAQASRPAAKGDGQPTS